jgi:cell division protein FtsW
MARFHGTVALPEGVTRPREKQLTILERFDSMTKSAETADPTRPAIGLFLCVLALLGLGLMIQANHAATTQSSADFWNIFTSQMRFRIAAIGALLLGYRIGPEGLRRAIPALVVFTGLCLVLVFVPGFADPKNGANRWLVVPGFSLSFQPSELARIVMILWVADRCIRLGPAVRDMRRGVLPMLALGFVFFALILVETDLGGALLFLACFFGTMWVGGAQSWHVAGPVVGLGGTAFLLLLTFVSYVRQRVLMWFGHSTNSQVDRTADALASGDFFGVGLGQGLFRNARVPYLESDYVLALVGEELGLVGVWLVLGLLLGLVWYGLRFVLAIRDRYCALCAFGLLLSVALQAMVHVQVVTRLAPPKGMPLPFISHGGTALVVSSLAIGLALGAARPHRARVSKDEVSP